MDDVWYAWRHVETRVIHGYEVRVYVRNLGALLVDSTDYKAEVYQKWMLIHTTDTSAIDYWAWMRATHFIDCHMRSPALRAIGAQSPRDEAV